MSTAAAPDIEALKGPREISGTERAMQDATLREEKKRYSSKVKTRGNLCLAWRGAFL